MMIHWQEKLVAMVSERPNCELMSNQLRHQPINLITNAAYFIAAGLTFELIRNNPKLIKRKWWVWLIGSVGVGSSLHHVWPNNLTLWLDGMPIYIVLFVVIVQILIKIFGSSRSKALLAGVGFLAAVIIIALLVKVPFDPSLAFLVVFSGMFLPLVVISIKKYKSETRYLLVALGWFGLGMVMAVADEYVCRYFPIGTHFVWHLATAAALYFMVSYFLKIEIVERGL